MKLAARWGQFGALFGASSGSTFLLGIILRALWFLPGDEEKPIRKLLGGRRG